MSSSVSKELPNSSISKRICVRFSGYSVCPDEQTDPAFKALIVKVLRIMNIDRNAVTTDQSHKRRVAVRFYPSIQSVEISFLYSGKRLSWVNKAHTTAKEIERMFDNCTVEMVTETL